MVWTLNLVLPLLICFTCHVIGDINVKVGENCPLCTGEASEHGKNIYNFEWEDADLSKTLKLETKLLADKYTHPLFITVFSENQARSWQLPYKAKGVSHESVSRMLCLQGNRTSEMQKVTVIVTTLSKNAIKFSIKLIEVDNFTVGVNSMSSVRGVTAMSPEYRYVDLRSKGNSSLLNVRVHSEDEHVCAIVSVQPAGCPVSDTEDVIRSKNAIKFQSMLEVASFNIDREHYARYDGIYIVFVVLADDALCGNNTAPSRGRTKHFTFKITNDLDKFEMGWEVAVSVAVLFILGCVGTIPALFLSYSEKLIKKQLEEELKELDRRQSIETTKRKLTSIREEEQEKEGEIEGQNDNGTEMTILPITGHVSGIENADEGDEDTLKESKASRVSQIVYITDLENRPYMRQAHKPEVKFQQSGLNIWLLFAVGMFYTIPVVQLVLTHLRSLEETGNQDECFYNFLCSTPYLAVADFNHIFSNMWYMGFGALFVFSTWYRQRKHRRYMEMREKMIRKEDKESKYGVPMGVPQRFGIFYAVGYAIAFEGILSACYHVCPTNVNFQFDTTFMMIISTLAMLKIYQLRHPDLGARAYVVFLGLGGVIFLVAIGVYEDTVIRIVVFIEHALTSVFVTYVMFHYGEVSLDHKIFLHMYRSVTQIVDGDFSWTPRHIALLFVVNGLNFAMIVYGAISGVAIPNYLLFVFLGNLFFYATHYIAMKIYHKERVTWHPIVFGILALASAVPALIFFGMKQYKSDLTPAQSRNLNEECYIPGLMDNHDIWHMLSASGLYFTFNMILTLDNGLYNVPRDKIRIF